MTTPQAIKKLSKFLTYVLGRQPDEFGLLPDASGFVKIKTLLQSMHEDPEWRSLRQGHLQTLMLAQQPAVIEIQGDLIRACDRSQLPQAVSPAELPKLLFTAVRRRAYPVVHSKGLRPAGASRILLTPDAATALRLGRRIDQDPVLLTIQVAPSQAAGTTFEQYGARLFLADFVPARTISGPPLPKEKPPAAPAPKAAAPERPRTPGSFFPDPTAFERPGAPRSGGRHEKDWKKDRRRARKEKARR